MCKIKLFRIKTPSMFKTSKCQKRPKCHNALNVKNAPNVKRIVPPMSKNRFQYQKSPLHVDAKKKVFFKSCVE